MKRQNLYTFIFRPSPTLKKNLRMAHMNVDPKRFIRRNISVALQTSVVFSFFLFFMFLKFKVSLWKLLITFPIIFVMFYWFFMNSPKVYIRRREREIKRDILFATRYLLVKIESGVPLFNAMIDASQSYGVAGGYFKEIVDEINIGKPIEEALEDAFKYNASHEFQLVLRQILNSLKTGVDISESLKKLLEEFTKQQQLEIKVYSKKLNSIVLFYLIIACVLPSLGISMFVIFASMMGLVLNLTNLMLILFFVSIIQLLFMSIIRSIRPAVDI